MSSLPESTTSAASLVVLNVTPTAPVFGTTNAHVSITCARSRARTGDAPRLRFAVGAAHVESKSAADLVTQLNV
jgi:hypothetical protein